ncbi:YveK family protein [Neobacillus drentensis]|uniref:YveK family protein n=1 Tax=Neobacillus drentensis TaxID=220684 RepID=UPI000824A430|nr:Wzz/FepE/Etk N-terminal domain-containing protein [Neobacillus drentensis]
MEDTISLVETLKIFRKRWNLILLLTLSAGLIGTVVCFIIMKPVYQASTQILVNQKNAESLLDSGRIQSNINLINTYSDIIKSPPILEKVITRLDLTQSVEDLNKNINVISKDNSQVFYLIVEADKAKNAVNIANTVSETSLKEIKGLMNVDNVTIISYAELKDKPVPIKPKKGLIIAISIVLGLIAGMGISLLLELLDNTLKDEKDVADYLGLPVLGSIQELKKNN